MQVTVVGTGYVGLVSGTCFSEFGHKVTCIDKNADKIAQLDRGEVPIYEPGLEAMIKKNVAAGHLRFSTDLASAVPTADVIFLAVGTPSRRGDGHADLTFVFEAAAEIADNLDGYTIVVTKSTVPVGTGARLEKFIRERRPDAAFDIASNPEFLREGSAIEDFMRPNRVVVGRTNNRVESAIRELYRPLFLNETPVMFTSRESAEVIKYASNAFLATKISFINEIADLCEAVGGNVQEVARGMGLDQRIGPKFLHAGPGYGGSCFPKDTLALLKTGEQHAVPLRLVTATVEVNTTRKKHMANRIIAACGGSVEGRKIAILGLTFKPNTDDMRDSPSLDIIPALVAAGADIHAYDPKGMEEAKRYFTDITYCDDAYGPLEDAAALIIITEWNQFRALDLDRVKQMMRDPCIIDLRNIYARSNLPAHGFRYYGIGHGTPATDRSSSAAAE